MSDPGSSMPPPPPTPVAFARPKTVPPPLPQTFKPSASFSLSHSSSISHSSSSLSFSSAVHHSRHSSASSTLAAVEEDRDGENGLPLPSLDIDEQRTDIVAQAIEEEEEEKQMVDEKQREDAEDEEEKEEDDEDEDTEGAESQEEEQIGLLIGNEGPTEDPEASPLSASPPLGRAFAIFGREIRHVSPNDSLSLSSPPLQPTSSSAPSAGAKKKPRTVPPPLPTLTPMSPPAAPSPVNSRISLPPTLSVPLARTSTGGESPSPLQTPLTPITPGSPTVTSPTLRGESAALASGTPLLPGPGDSPALSSPVLPAVTRSAASSVATASSSLVPKERSSLPAGFQFAGLKLKEKAAPAESAASKLNAMSASSPIHPSSTPPSGSSSASSFSHSSTAPCVLASSPARISTAASSEPTSPRRVPSATLSSPVSQQRSAEPDIPLLRPATADARMGAQESRRGREDKDGKDSLVAGGAGADGGGMQKQKCSKCVSFSVRGVYCLKHLYHAGLSALVSPTASAPPPRLSATLHPSSSVYTDKMLKISDELLKTEKSYYEALKVAYRSFQLRLEVAASFADHPSELLGGLQSVGGEKGGSAVKGGGGLGLLPVLSSGEIGTIFSKLHDIFTLSSNLYHDLSTLNSIRIHAELSAASATPPSPSTGSLTLLLPFLGSTLLHYSSYFRVYQAYLENYDDAIRTLVALRQSNHTLDVWLTWQEKCEQTLLDSLLIMPVQRLPRYLLLLQEIMRVEESRRSADTAGLFSHYPLAYHDILTARDRISRIADAINLSLHEKEAAQTVSHLQSLFDRTDNKFVPFATPTRKLMKEGTLRKINETRKNHFLRGSSSYRFFLLNDLFLYAEESKKLGGMTRYKLKNTIPLLDLRVVEGKGGSGSEKELRLRNEVSGKMLTVSGKSVEEIGEWRAKIEECQQRLQELTNSMHVNTFDGVLQDKKERSNKNKAMLMMGIGEGGRERGK